MHQSPDQPGDTTDPQGPSPSPTPSSDVHAGRGPRHRWQVVAIGFTAALALSATAVAWTHSSNAGQASTAASVPAQSAPSQATPSPRTSSAPSARAATEAGRALAHWADPHAASEPSAVPGPGGSIIDVVRIPALGKDWAQPVYQGTGPDQLRAGLGHFDGTEAAGQVGNFVLAGHRSGIASPPLRDIDNIKAGAAITVSTPERITYTYTVTSISTVAPTDVAVTAQVPGRPGATPTKALLTLVTCWPADGHSKRVVVEATLASTRGSEL
ncbi:sortase [Streptomyces sp. ET3-23]|uniref:sortase n=1 Tax=Streptomyces sp. ET3-23 TaxID=2885643 RepID=UPI001D10D7E5|nr:sortase [Streptomyces sp. ET3-23]MCC2275513.1 sortase [Streptomyces sp. ET3-23]